MDVPPHLFFFFSGSSISCHLKLLNFYLQIFRGKILRSICSWRNYWLTILSSYFSSIAKHMKTVCFNNNQKVSIQLLWKLTCHRPEASKGSVYRSAKESSHLQLRDRERRGNRKLWKRRQMVFNALCDGIRLRFLFINEIWWHPVFTLRFLARDEGREVLRKNHVNAGYDLPGENPGPMKNSLDENLLTAFTVFCWVQLPVGSIKIWNWKREDTDSTWHSLA